MDSGIFCQKRGISTRQFVKDFHKARLHAIPRFVHLQTYQQGGELKRLDAGPHCIERWGRGEGTLFDSPEGISKRFCVGGTASKILPGETHSSLGANETAWGVFPIVAMHGRSL